MPYINQDDRPRAVDNPRDPGELNFALTVRMLRLADLGAEYGRDDFAGEATGLLVGYMAGRVLCYDLINEVLGALFGASCEFGRRVPEDHPYRMAALQSMGEVANTFYLVRAAPYERSKIAENGDVYPRDW